MLLWCDIETTGLNPREDAILEVGIIATTDSLDEVWRVSRVCRYTGDLELLSPYVRNMHRESQLWAECANTTKTRSEIEQWLLSLLRAQYPDDAADKNPMCGSTIGFDRAFLKAQMPELHDFFHYRSIDVSTLTELARRWYPDIYASRPGADESKRPHRALPDLEGSIALLKYYRRTMLVEKAK